MGVWLGYGCCKRFVRGVAPGVCSYNAARGRRDAAVLASRAMRVPAVPGAALPAAAFVLWQAASIAWSIEPARSWDYANRSLVYLAFAAVGALLGGIAFPRLVE